MRTTFYMRLLLGAVGLSLSAHATFPQGATGDRSVSFCDLVARPADFDGKTVKVTATYNFGPEGSSFSDDRCDDKETPSKAAAFAEFSGVTREAARASKVIGAAMRKNNSLRLNVEMIALFKYPEASGELPRSCCRSTLVIQRVLSVTKWKPDGSGNSPNP